VRSFLKYCDRLHKLSGLMAAVGKRERSASGPALIEVSGDSGERVHQYLQSPDAATLESDKSDDDEYQRQEGERD
jgi:hypothetical protein